MNITTTGIAVTAALAVTAFFFIIPSFASFFGLAGPAQTPPASSSPNAPMPQLKITDDKIGSGPVAVTGDTVTVNYVGKLDNGTEFDASANHPQTKNGFTFTLGAGQVIKGWDEGIAGMKVGGVRTLVIPPALAYGDQGAGNVIPPGATLTFTVTLLKVQKGQ